MPPIEPLESRTLCAVSYRFNFQPYGSELIPFYRPDSGLRFGVRGNGITYGWTRNIAAYATIAKSSRSPDARYDSALNMSAAGSVKWEIVVPNGQYRVRVVAGNPDTIGLNTQIKLEDVRILSGITTNNARFLDGVRKVDVTDNRLTISNAPTANSAAPTENEIRFIEIKQLTSGGATWATGPSAPASLGEVAGGVIGNRIYIAGNSSGRTLAYDLNTGTWLGNTIAQRPQLGKDHMSEVFNGKLYLFGGIRYGNNGFTALNQTQIYDPVTNRWSYGAPMPAGRFAGQTALINGAVYIAGGVTSANVTSNAMMIYNPTKNKWSTVSAFSMPRGVNSAAAGTDGRRLFIFGGRTGGDAPGNAFNDVQIFDTQTGTWTTSQNGAIAPLPTPRAGILKAPYVNGEFVIIGGEEPNRIFDNVEAYNPASNTWRTLPALPTPRHGLSPFAVGNKIYVACGGVISGESSSSLLEILTV